MAKAPTAEVVVPGPGGEGADRTVRVSSPDRIIYPATDLTPEVSKLQVAQYFAAVGEPLLAAIGDRPTALERWPGGVHPGGRLAQGPQDRDADGFYQKRMMKGAPEYAQTVRIAFPSGRPADELCPSEIAIPVWCAQMGTITFHPWPVRSADVDHPDELRIDLDPQPGTDFRDAVRVAGIARELADDLGLRAYCKTSGNRGVHVFIRIAPRWDFVDVRHAAIAFGRELEKRDSGVTTAWWKEERGERIFVDYNQNSRDRTIASAWSLRAVQGATVSTPLTWDALAELKDPHELNLFTVPERLADGNPWADMDEVAHDLTPLLEKWEQHPVELNYPPDYPKMPGEPPRVQPSKKVAEHWDADGNRIE
ncbi:DNA polymerase domain-containing protein [Tsukamurella asaccharolytica]|uniref:DNA polymerase domain-containing protein n=1 Tax=Tsukamurella asaccharolytica TaxID=2592067 RepID=A0A5C5RCD3_9ACTN|nr:DNA polymerase domain-containing protein [Tsukamurella asaccharolytica]TWS20747.1 DNA polymerase domain-containing protein [Tsukamurella asaccharolytica]